MGPFGLEITKLSKTTGQSTWNRITGQSEVWTTTPLTNNPFHLDDIVIRKVGDKNAYNLEFNGSDPRRFYQIRLAEQ